MPKILGIIGSIIGAFFAFGVLVVWQGNLSEIRNFFDAVWAAVVMASTIGFFASLLVVVFHNSNKRLGWLKANVFSLAALTWVLGICITPSIIMYDNNMTGISWPPPSDLVMLLLFFAFACGTGHYILYRIGFGRTH